MLNYEEVVKNRFDQEEDPEKSIYAPNHPIGIYSRKVLFTALDKVIKDHFSESDELNQLLLLDIGCGNGGMLQYFIEQGFDQKKLFGIDLSESRITRAKLKLPEADFSIGDVTKVKLEPEKFDAVSAFDLFSHLKTKEDIIAGLSNIYDSLKPGGVFIWYDIYAADHFEVPESNESWGFSKEQFKQFASECNFEIKEQKPLFKKFFNRYHSLYQANKLPSGILQILERILPGNPGNMMNILIKNT